MGHYFFSKIYFFYFLAAFKIRGLKVVDFLGVNKDYGEIYIRYYAVAIGCVKLEFEDFIINN